MNNELLERITQTFEKRLKKVNIKAKSYEDVNEYAVVLGEILTTAFNIHINENPGNSIEEILNDRLKENHRFITERGRLVQDILNRQANIGLGAQIPKVNQSRIDGLVNRLTEGDFEKSKWLLGSPIVNFSQSVVDDMVRKNAEFHFKSGMSPKIIRKETGKCCKWCKNLVGTYRYPDVPKDVYRRHQNCRCTVEYIPKKGIRQDVHTKKIKYETKEGTKELAYASIKSKWLKNYKEPKVSVAKFWEYNGTKYFVDKKTVFLDYSIKEKEVAEIIANKFGVEIFLNPKVYYPENIPTSDFTINNVNYDLKEIISIGRNNIDTAIKGGKKQASNFVLDYTKSGLSRKEIDHRLNRLYKNPHRKWVENIILIKDNVIEDIVSKK
ncbi:hypothetical protein HMPREF1983_00936 [Gemella bergeri ATCC 700627]|uniref:tRNA nuclease CdiA C-terminal domain-containing protein n=1 Tax=Gemella bergeri ATCC 700627 TaxID=1321820 RepID=U2RW86_9BACL|nr:hypothetical protein [Gemella bergeri]ERK57833.1 hypothetical protein HMPREF1983_00936 [Gemella bergeri ATCC 700627]